MDNGLMLYSSGAPVPGRDRKVAKQGKDVFDEVRLRGMQIDGAMALAGHIMEEAVELDAKRLSLAAGDPMTAALLADIEATALRQAKAIQSSLYSRWGI